MNQYTFILTSYARKSTRVVLAENYDLAIEKISEIVNKSLQYYDFILQSTTDSSVNGTNVLDKI